MEMTISLATLSRIRELLGRGEGYGDIAAEVGLSTAEVRKIATGK